MCRATKSLIANRSSLDSAGGPGLVPFISESASRPSFLQSEHQVRNARQSYREQGDDFRRTASQARVDQEQPLLTCVL